MNTRTYIKDGASDTTAIRNIIRQQNYKDDIADVLCNLMRYMKINGWVGACHATASVIYVALSELGYKPSICIGEVKSNTVGIFDHSWIELDGKIIDLTCAMPLKRLQPVNDPIIFDIDSYTGEHHTMEYGIYKSGLDHSAKTVQNMAFTDYLDGYPFEKNGLWGVIRIVLDKKIDITSLKNKYKNTQRQYVHKEQPLS